MTTFLGLLTSCQKESLTSCQTHPTFRINTFTDASLITQQTMHDMHQAMRSEEEIFGGPCPLPGMDLMVTVINNRGHTRCFLPCHGLWDWKGIVHLFSLSPSSSAQEHRKKLI